MKEPRWLPYSNIPHAHFFLAMLCARGSTLVPGSQQTVHKRRYPQTVNDRDQTRLEATRLSRSSARPKDNVEDKQDNDREADQHVKLAPGPRIYERSVETKSAIYLSPMALSTAHTYFVFDHCQPM